MIEISDKYKIDADKYNYILHTARNGKKKVVDSFIDVVVWDQSYFPNIKQCANAIVDNELRKAIESGLISRFDEYVSKLIVLLEDK